MDVLFRNNSLICVSLTSNSVRDHEDDDANIAEEKRK